MLGGILAVLTLVFIPASVRAQLIVEFPIPTAGSGPSSILPGPDGNLYFLETHGIGRITPDGSIAEASTSCSPVPGPPWTTYPNISLAAGTDGNLWYTGACWMRGGGGFGVQQGILGTMSLDGAFHVVLNSVDIAPAGITTDPDGNLWYADSRGKIVRTTPGGFITEYPVPVPIAPVGIASGAEGFLWFTEGFAPNIGRISVNGEIILFPLLSMDRRAGTGALGPDGNMWFPESSQDGVSYWIARITPSGVITEFPIPTESAGAGAVTAGPDGNMWFTESGYGTNTTSKIGRIDLAGSMTEFPIPTPNSAPAGITTGPDGNIWFTEFGASKIGRLDLGQLPGCAPTATALCLASGRFRVEAQWRRPSDSIASAGHAVAITGDTGYFWFFDPSNIEVVAKVLNGCQVDGRYWFFASGLTNVEVALTATDTQTSAVKTYPNPQGSPFVPIQDTAAFSTCP